MQAFIHCVLISFLMGVYIKVYTCLSVKKLELPSQRKSPEKTEYKRLNQLTNVDFKKSNTCLNLKLTSGFITFKFCF